MQRGLTMLVGISGSGKTYWRNAVRDEVKEHTFFATDSVVKSYYYSKYKCLDYQDHMNEWAANQPSFPAFFWRRFDNCIASNRAVMAECNFLTPETRKPYIDMAREWNIPVYAVVFRTPLEISMKRNQRQKKQYRLPAEAIIRESELLDISTVDNEVDFTHYVDNIQIKGQS